MQTIMEGMQLAAAVCKYDPATHRVRVRYPPPRRDMVWLGVCGNRPPPGHVLTGYVCVSDDGTGEAVCEFAPCEF